MQSKDLFLRFTLISGKMLFKRSHTLKYKNVVTTDAYQDENNDWVPGTTTETVIELECRSEPNGEGKVIPSQNGQNTVFNRVVFLDNDIMDIPFGKEVEIFNNGVFIVKETVKLFERYTKFCKLWV